MRLFTQQTSIRLAQYHLLAESRHTQASADRPVLADILALAGSMMVLAGTLASAHNTLASAHSRQAGS